MIIEKKKKKKASISEEDISLILQRYTATTILTLLQEVDQFIGVKIDWNVLVKKTSTGISNAREYQMLWRHLAYRDTLIEKVEHGVEPLDDDSDLEIELEPSPAVNGEASTDAAACVKVLIASGSPSESGPPNRATVEAPLTINIPNGQSLRNPSDHPLQVCSTQGTNITVPVSVQKQPLPSVSSFEALDGNGSISAKLPPRKKRQRWSAEEDNELIAAVQKCGEGNWANILKGDFKHDRTASQLSQRWSIIRKRQKVNLATSSAGNSTDGTLTEAQLAARQAVSLALNMPMKGSLSATSSLAAATHSSIHGNPSIAPATTTDVSPMSAATAEASSKAPVIGSPQIIHQSQPAPNQTTLPRVASTSNPAPPKSRSTSKKHSISVKNAPTVPNPFIQAAAVLAGARIANPSTAASLFKAAQSRNAVHIRQGGSVPQSSMPGARPLGTNTVGALPPNVHYIRTGLASHQPTYSGMVPNGPRSGSQHVQGGSGRLAVMGQPPLTGPTPSLNPQVVPESKSASPTCENADSNKSPSVSTVAADVSAASEVKCAEEKKLDSMAEVQKESVRDQASLPNLKAGGNHSEVDDAGENPSLVVRQTDVADASPGENLIAVDMQMDHTNRGTCDNEIVGNKTGENQSNMEVCESQIVISKARENQNAIEQQEVCDKHGGV